jgi:hypothetical protein
LRIDVRGDASLAIGSPDISDSHHQVDFIFGG